MSQVRARPPKPKPVIAVQTQAAAPSPAGGERLEVRWLVAAGAALVATWLAAGSMGLLGHPLRHALTWIAVIVSVLAGWPSGASTARTAATVLGLLLSVVLLISQSMAVNVMGVALVGASLAWSIGGVPRRVMVVVATSAAVLGIYRFAYTSIPIVWYLADGVGSGFGRFAGWICGSPLNVGSTFGGVDYLVVMLTIYAGLLLILPSPRGYLAIFGLVAILLVHLAYLIVLAVAPTLLPPPPPPPAPSPTPVIDPKTPFSLVETIRPLVPWNLPIIAAMLHTGLAVLIFRWTFRPGSQLADLDRPRYLSSVHPRALAIAATILGLILPATSMLYVRKPSLVGKKIVLYEKGFLNWLKPKHGDYGRLSIGMYGMIPIYLESLGAKVVVSKDLSEADLTDASVVAFFFPNEEWEAGKVARLQKFVEDGGSMLVLGEHTIHEGKTALVGDRPNSRFNDLLMGLASDNRGEKNLWSRMYVPFDSATFEIGGWLQSYEQMAHPTTAGLRDDRNQLGVVIGASVNAKFPAEPFIVGRWGYNDPGDDGNEPSLMGNHRYDPGDRLGDLILAAEEQIGKGKVVAFGDTSGFTNGITYGSHIFTSRLWAHAADARSTGHSLLRQLLAILAGGALLCIVIFRPSELTVCAAALAMSASLALCTGISHRTQEQLPDGRLTAPNLNNLAYITTSHLESSSEESWRAEGTMGLAMNFMRNGYLALSLPEITWERLQRAAIVVCVGPQRSFSEEQIRIIRRFVSEGGIFILTAGYDCREAAQPLAREFGMYIGNRPDDSGEAPPPEPMGHFKSPYIDLGTYMAHVRFNAAWPVGHFIKDPTFRVIANGHKNLPVILQRRVNQGTFVLVGDTGFVMNKNLEWEDGRAFDGMRENADFWRWYLTDLTDQQRWIPPKQEPPAPPATQPVAGGGS